MHVLGVLLEHQPVCVRVCCFAVGLGSPRSALFFSSGGLNQSPKKGALLPPPTGGS